MLNITITTPLGDIEIQHSKQTAKAVGSKDAVDFWNIDVKDGLFGVHGHTFDPKNCDIADVISAAIESVGFSKFTPPTYLIILLSSTINPEESSPLTPTVRVLFSGSETDTLPTDVWFSSALNVDDDAKIGASFTSVILISTC